MLKVFLVEDEYVVREGIKKNVDWTSHGYEFCGEASDGEQAFPMIQKLKPDIVITDIKMPFMDGLALSRLIKKELPWIEIIILSGYSEFEYAKEGIKIGVAEYITKPISGNDLLKTVDALSEKVIEKQKEREIRKIYEQEMEENYSAEKRELFGSLVQGNKTVPELLDCADKLRMDLSALWYNIVLLKINSKNHAANEYSDSRIEIEQKIRKIDDEKSVLIFDRNLEGSALLFKADSLEDITIIQQEFIGKVLAILKEYPGVTYYGGIGTPVDRMREIPNSFERASHAFAHRYLVKESQILDCEQLAEEKAIFQEEFDISAIDARHMDRSRIRGFLKSGDYEEAGYFVEEFFNGLGKSAVESNMFRQYIMMDTFFCVSEFVEALSFSRDEIEAPDMMSGVLQTVDATMKYVIRIIQTALGLRDKAASNRYGDVVDEVKKYIEENYADENLSLNLLATHVNFSPNHLSMIFSQETGETFIKYLTDYRMAKAKELLRCTGMRSSAIGNEVGYKDPHYFSFLFKKTQGMTPTQYRGGKAAEGED